MKNLSTKKYKFLFRLSFRSLLIYMFLMVNTGFVFAQGVTIDRVRFTDTAGSDRTAFLPGESGQVHVDYTLDADDDKNVVVRGRINGPKEPRGKWRTRLESQKNVKQPGGNSDSLDFTVDPNAIVGSEALVNVNVRTGIRIASDQTTFNIVDEIPTTTTTTTPPVTTTIATTTTTPTTTTEPPITTTIVTTTTTTTTTIPVEKQDPPVLEPIGDQSVTVGDTLTLNITATDPNNDSLTFSVSPFPLPNNSTLNAMTGVFTFSPSEDQVGTITLTFTVSDGTLTDSETITITVPELPPDGTTALIGQVLDTMTLVPLENVRLSIGSINIFTDINGEFLMSGIPAGVQPLTIDGSAVTMGDYPTLTENVTLIEGVANVRNRPIFLPNLDMANADPVNPNDTSIIDSADVIMEGENFGPVVLTVPPNTAMNSETGEPFTDSISITTVPSDRSPLPLPDDMVPSIYITIQPFNVVFDPPVPISFPNVEGFAPGAEVDIFGLNRETGEFENQGPGIVSSDGATVDSVDGMVTGGSWHAFVSLSVIVDDEGRRILVIDKGWQKKQTGTSAIGVRDGSISIDHTLPGILSLNETASVRINYNSDTANPRPVINFNVNNPLRGPIPTSISTRLSVAGLDQGEFFTDGTSLPFNVIEPFRQAFQFDASALPTGSYPYLLEVACNFPISRRVAPAIEGQLIVNNESASPFGAGWTIDGLSRLHIQDNGMFLLTEGDGSSRVFAESALLEDTFDSENDGIGVLNFSNLANWDVTEGTVDLIGNGFFDFFPGNGLYLDLDGSTSNAATMESKTTFDLDPADYELTFNLAGSQRGDDNTVAVKLADVFNEEFTFASNEPFTTITRSLQVLSSTSGKLRFDHMGGDNLGLLLDNVKLERKSGVTTFSSPFGDLLVKNDDGTFTRTLIDDTRIEYNAKGLQTAIVDVFGNNIAYTYDSSDRLSTIIYPTNQTFSFSYGENSLASVTDPADRVTQFTVDSANNLTSIADPNGETIRYEYDNKHLLKKLTTAMGSVYNYTYDVNGMIQEVKLPNSEVRQFRPSQCQGLPGAGGEGTKENPMQLVMIDDISDTFTNGTGNTTKFKTDRMGSVVQEIDSESQITNITRDENGNIIRLVKPNGTAVNLTYDVRGNLISIEEETDGSISRFTYDENDDLDGIITPEARSYQIGYDANGSPVSFTHAGGTVNKVYNEKGLPTTVTNAVGNTIMTFGYDGNGNVIQFTDGEGHTSAFTRDKAGNIIGAVDAEGHVNTITYDQKNHPLIMTNERGSTLSFEYDAQGNPLKCTDANGAVTRFEYDETGLQTKTIDPLGGVTEYSYDLLQNRSMLTRPDGRNISYAYDSIHRRNAINLDDGDEIIFEYDSFNSLTRVADNDSDLRLNYSPLGQLTEMVYGNAGNPDIVDPSTSILFSYDLDGNLTSFTDPQGKVTNVLYDDRPALKEIANEDITHAITLDPAGRLTEISAAVIGGAGSNMSRTYTVTDQLQKLVNSANGVTISSFDIELSNIGNRNKITDNTGNDNIYIYDESSQLLTVSHQDQPDESYTYDVMGNRLTSHFEPGPAQFDAANRIIRDSTFTYTHDVNGNLSSKTNIATGEKRVYTYNVLNQLIQIDKFDAGGVRTSQISYTYNPLGKRTSKNVDGAITKYIWNKGGEVVAEFDGNDNLLATYMYGVELQMPLSMERGGEQFVYHRDYLGSVIQITDSNGAIVNKYQYDSFGRIISKIEEVPNHFLFTGVQFDEESGLYYMEARYYDPDLGRFLQPDPLFIVGSGPNLYAYVKNNPVNFKDPNGLIGFGAIAGAAVNLAGQGVDYLASKKGESNFSIGSLIFDVALGAATCGLSTTAQAAKLATKVPKLTKAINISQKVLSNPAGNAFISSFGKDIVVNQKLDANTVRDFALNFGFNKLGKGLAKDFDDIAQDTAVAGVAATTEALKNLPGDGNLLNLRNIKALDGQLDAGFEFFLVK